MTQKHDISINDVAVVTIGGNEYRIHFWFITKSKVVDRMKNAHGSEKSGQI